MSHTKRIFLGLFEYIMSVLEFNTEATLLSTKSYIYWKKRTFSLKLNPSVDAIK